MTSITFSCMGFSLFVKHLQFSQSLASQTMNIYCGSLPLWIFQDKKICEAFTWNEAIRLEHYWNLTYALASPHTSPCLGNALVLHLYPRSRWQMWTKMLSMWLEAPSENLLVQLQNFFHLMFCECLRWKQIIINHIQFFVRISIMLQTSFILSQVVVIGLTIS